MSPTRIALMVPVCAALMALASCGDSGDDSARVQAQVQQAVDQVRKEFEAQTGYPVPSLNVLLQTPERRVFVSSSGRIGGAITENTTFRFASNTKMFTATAIMNMHEDGWLDYRARIVDPIPGTATPYVPDSPEWAIPFKDRITIEQLLQHSAGVYDVDNGPVPGFGGKSFVAATADLDPGHQFDSTQMVEQLTLNNLSYFEPGTAHRYSNTGYVMLSEIIARVYSARSGVPKTFADYLNDYLTGQGGARPVAVPLPLVFPIAAGDTRMPSPSVPGTVLSDEGIRVYGEVNMSAQIGEGNGYGTMANLNTFVRTLLKGENVLTPATIALMKASRAPGEADYGLGVQAFGVAGHGHTGARVGNLSLTAYDPVTDTSMVVYLAMWDQRGGNEAFFRSFNAMLSAALAAREALGLPVEP